MPASEGKFNDYRIGDLFTAQTGDVDLQQSDINGQGEYFINSGIQSCGIKGKTDRAAKIFDANTITIDFFGNAYYRSYRYKMATHNHVFSLSGDILKNEKVGLYIVAQLSYLKKVFSYNNMGTWPKIKEQIIRLPVDKQGDPDFKHMESCVDYIFTEKEDKLNKFYDVNGFSDCSLTEEELQAFANMNSGKVEIGTVKLGSLFDIHPTKTHKGTNSTLFATRGKHPVVVNSSVDNGIGGRVGLPTTEKGNKITFSDTTTSEAIFYQPDNFIGYSHVQALYEKNREWSQNELLYFLTAFKKNAKGRFDYATKFTRSLASSMDICLPVSPNGSIDYAFMETYINALKKLCIDRLKASDIFTHQNTAIKQPLTSNVIVTADEDRVFPIHETYDVPINDRFSLFLPLYDIAIACGALVDEGVQSLGRSDVEVEGWIDVSDCGFKPNAQMFIVRAKGESMLPRIRPDDLCVFETYGPMNAGSRDGKIVLARQSGKDNDYNCQYTIKEYHSEKDSQTGHNVKVELRPLNDDPHYSSIEVNDAEGEIVVIATLKEVIH